MEPQKDRSIRERWPALTARERDVEVAKAKGWTKIERPQHPEIEARGGLWRTPNRSTFTLPPFTDWSETGLLLEELAVLGWTGVQYADGLWCVESKATGKVSGLNLPEAVSLAYVLAKEKP